MILRAAALFLGTLLAACASPNPTLYTLAVLPGPTHSGAPHVIELRSVALARYLERSQIVRSSEGYHLDVLANDWWGEPLDSMLGRVLVEELTDRLPGSTIYAENTAISVTPDATVAINVQRLDADASGAVVLIAQVAVTARGAKTRNLRIAVSPASAGTPALVAAMSNATAQLADAVAAMLAGR